MSGDPYALSWDQAMTRMRMEMRFAFAIGTCYRDERDPYLDAFGKGWRHLFGALRDGFGYEFRKASGRLRRVSMGNPNAHTVITGITS